MAAWKNLMRRDDVHAAARAGTTWWIGLIKIERALDSSPDELLCLVREAAGRVLRPNQNLERSAEDKEET